MAWEDLASTPLLHMGPLGLAHCVVCQSIQQKLLESKVTSVAEAEDDCERAPGVVKMMRLLTSKPV